MRQPQETDRCEIRVVHEDIVGEVRQAQADETEIGDLAALFQLLGSPARLRIVEALTGRELCVCDLAASVGVSESGASHHLRQLRQMRIVRYRREGRMAYYRLDDDHIASLLETGFEHVRE